MFDSQYIADARLKAHFIGLSSNQVALSRLKRKLGKKASKIWAKEFKPKEGENVDVKANLLKSINYRLGHNNRERYLVRCEARATHLLRAFLRGQAYNRVEQNVKEGTISATRVIADYFPEGLVPMEYKLVEAIRNWAEKPEEKQV